MIRFLKHLEKDPHAKRLREVFLRLPATGPELQRAKARIWQAAEAAMVYVHQSRYFVHERAARLKHDPHLADLRREHRRLRVEVASFRFPELNGPGLPLTAEGYIALRGHESRKKRLAAIDGTLRGYLRAMNTKRHGKNDDLGLIFFLREMLERPQGARIARLSGNDLMAILDAALYAIKKTQPHKNDPVLRRTNAANLLRQLKRFERENAPFLATVSSLFPHIPQF